MKKFQKEIIRKHLQNLNDNWYKDEMYDYAEQFLLDEPEHLQNPEYIRTEYLKEHNYKDLRMLIDYFEKKGVFIDKTFWF